MTLPELSYEIKDAVTLESYARRRPNITAESVEANVDFKMLVATISESTNELYVETQYSIELRGSEDEDPDDPLAVLRSRVGVVMVPSRKILESEVADGTLMFSQVLARQTAQAYHRQIALHQSVQLGLAPVLLPADFTSVADEIESPTQRQELASQ